MTSEYIVKEAVLAMHDVHSDSSADEDSSLLSCYTNAICHWLSTFWRNVVPPF